MKDSVGHHKKSGFSYGLMIRMFQIEAVNAPVNFIVSEILAGHDAPPHQKSQPDPGPEHSKSLIQQQYDSWYTV